MRVGVLASGAGPTCRRCWTPSTAATASRSSRSVRPARGPGAARARTTGVATEVFSEADYADREARDRAMAVWLDERGVELVVLAGYMQLLDARPSSTASPSG